MSKTVTLRLSDDVYQLFRQCAEDDNRSLSNFIETATLRFIELSNMTDEAETAEGSSDEAANRNIAPRRADARSKRGVSVE
jgi:predicted transcriptional regulator